MPGLAAIEAETLAPNLSFHFWGLAAMIYIYIYIYIYVCVESSHQNLSFHFWDVGPQCPGPQDARCTMTCKRNGSTCVYRSRLLWDHQGEAWDKCCLPLQEPCWLARICRIITAACVVAFLLVASLKHKQTKTFILIANKIHTKQSTHATVCETVITNSGATLFIKMWLAFNWSYALILINYLDGPWKSSICMTLHISSIFA